MDGVVNHYCVILSNSNTGGGQGLTEKRWFFFFDFS